MKQLLLLGSAIFTTLICSNNSFAFSISPMHLTLEPAGDGATQSFFIQNDHDESLQIETIAQDRTVGLKGEEDSKPSPQAAKDIVIYPPIFSLKPHEKRSIRVSYRGQDKSPSPELLYRILVKEIPSKTKLKDKSGAILYFNYVMAIYVTPSTATYKVVTKKVESTYVFDKKSKKDVHLMKLLLENEGDTHRYFKYYKITITPKDPELRNKKFVYTDKDGIATNSQIILARHQREFLIPWPPSVPTGDVDLKVEFNQ
jgi:P pilus assembly chaperone PapD